MQEKPQAVVYMNFKSPFRALGQAIGGASAYVLAGVRLSTTSFYGAAGPLGKKGAR